MEDQGAFPGVLRFSGALCRPLKEEQRAPENADFWNGQFSAFSGVLHFRVLF